MSAGFISIPSILKVGKGTLPDLGKYVKSCGMNNAVIYFGNDLIDLFGETVINSFKESDVNILKYKEIDSVKIDDIIEFAFEISNKAQVIIGIGGGKVIDAAKYAAYLRKLPFISVPTSSSSDGFSSASASLIVNERRTSVPAKMPFGIIVDTDVIKSAPTKFIYSGIGDLVSKITAIYDWVFEANHGVSDINDFAVMVAKKAVNSFVRTPYDSIQDDIFLRELLDSLAMSGVANEIAGNSSPTSGSEHLISHALDKLLERPELHGIQVGIATYIMSIVQNHRYERVRKVFTDTGFFDYVKSLNLNIIDYENAIRLAPSIKPHRYTYLHETKYQDIAIETLYNDSILKDIFNTKG